MTQVGVVEVIAGTFLVLGPRVARMLSCLVLAFLMIGALYMTNMAKKPMEEIIIPGVVLFLTFSRLILFFVSTTLPQTEKKKGISDKRKSKKQQ